MSIKTKIVIEGKPGEPLNGKNSFLEVGGNRIDGEISTVINLLNDKIATAVITIVLPEIEYRDK